MLHDKHITTQKSLRDTINRLVITLSLSEECLISIEMYDTLDRQTMNGSEGMLRFS